MGVSQAQITALLAIATTAEEVNRGLARLRSEVEDARRTGATWDSIGNMSGLTGEAARKRFGYQRPVAQMYEQPALFAS